MSVPVLDRTAGRVAVIGDVGGHRRELVSELARLGADASGRLPEDLTVIQVGDLVHRGPDSYGVVALVDRYLRSQPRQWVQLAGNHEAHYLRDPVFRWTERLDPETVAVVRRWWREGRLLVAAAIEGEEDLLVTHAGLTAGYWRTVLGAPVDSRSAAVALNAQIVAGDDRLFRPGVMLGGGRPDPTAGPLWAQAGSELVASWATGSLPFSQVHGHSTVAGRDGALSGGAAGRTTVDRRAGHEVTELAGGRIIGVDPGHGRRPTPSWRSWEIG